VHHHDGDRYLIFAYATVSGFANNGKALSAAPIPFITVAHSSLAALAVFAYLDGLTSTMGGLIAAVNSQARLIFDAGREGVLPHWIGRVQPARRFRPAEFSLVKHAVLPVLGSLKRPWASWCCRCSTR
jgi:hypothetical protein